MIATIRARMRFVLGVLLLVGLVAGLGPVATAAAAKQSAPSASLTLTATPSTVAPGDRVTVDFALTNTSSTRQIFRLTLAIAGPCDINGSVSFPIFMRAGQSVDLSLPLRAPRCTGTYTLSASLSAGGQVIASASASVTVE
jgi:uncharacterized protein YfaS (alpha-2-macroglobulin family)